MQLLFKDTLTQNISHIVGYIDHLKIISEGAYTSHIIYKIHDSLPRFACWGDLIFSKFQNKFYACSEQPRQKLKSSSLFDTKIPAVSRFVVCVIIGGADKSLINSMLIDILEKFKM